MSKAQIKITKEGHSLIIERINSQCWLIDGKFYQPTEIVNKCCSIQRNFDIDLNKELVIFCDASDREVENVFYYDMCISNYEPTLIFK